MKFGNSFKITLMAAMITAAVSCSPSAEKMAEEYKTLAAELAQAKLDGDEKRVEQIKEEMEDLNDEIAKAAEKEMKKTGRKVKKEAKKAEKALEDLFN